jgi:hypothetical protein
LKRILAVVLAGIVGPGMAAAQAVPPSVDQILDKFVQAIGGKAAYERVTSRVSKGTFELSAQGMTGALEIYSKAPNKSLFSVDFPGFGLVQQAFDGTIGWADNPQTGLREITDQELSVTKRGAVFHQALKLRELYPKMTLKGQEKVGERQTYVIEADAGDGALRRMYFDAETGLMLRTTVERDMVEGRGAFDLLLEDYKEVDGVKVPFTVRATTPTFDYVIKLTEIKQNIPIDDAKFAKPTAQ